jgi:fructose-1,6-bisphosphatase/inositol monophosphatase family enzyme
MSISLSDLLIDATRIPARKLLRDYYELESLQNTGKKNDHFVLQSLKRIKENIGLELLKHRVTSKFFFKGDKEITDDLFIYVVPVDSVLNFSRARNNFGIMATLFKNNVPEMSVINFPAIKEIIYSQKDRGVWVEKLNRNDSEPTKIKASNTDTISKASIVTDDISLMFESPEYFQSFASCEIINSSLYNLYLLCHGMVDVCIINSDCDFFAQSLSFICKEVGADMQIFDHNKTAIITNKKIQVPIFIDTK